MSDDGAAAGRPLLQVVRGRPTDVELAAVTAVLTARMAAVNSDKASESRSAWSRGAGVRRPLPAPGPAAWRTSGRPG